MSLEKIYLCNFYFNITDPNDIKSFKRNNQVRKMIFWRRKREKECWKPGNVGIWRLLWWNIEELCPLEYLEDEEDANQLNPFYKWDHLQLRNPYTNKWLKHRCCWKKIIGKHAIKLKIHATPVDLKQANSKSINQTRINSYPNRRDLSPLRPTINQQRER